MTMEGAETGMSADRMWYRAALAVFTADVTLPVKQRLIAFGEVARAAYRSRGITETTSDARRSEPRMPAGEGHTGIEENGPRAPADPPWLDEAAAVALDAWRAGRKHVVAGTAKFADEWRDIIRAILAFCARQPREPIPMILFCPNCGLQHIDAPREGWQNPPHRSHLCAGCGHTWRPADVPTTGVAEIETSGQADTYPARRKYAYARLQQPRPITDAMVEAAMQALVGQGYRCWAYQIRAALDAAEKARADG